MGVPPRRLPVVPPEAAPTIPIGTASSTRPTPARILAKHLPNDADGRIPMGSWHQTLAKKLAASAMETKSTLPPTQAREDAWMTLIGTASSTRPTPARMSAKRLPNDANGRIPMGSWHQTLARKLAGRVDFWRGKLMLQNTMEYKC